MTNYSRSVLKSNGLRHSKNLPVKFGFTLKTVSANIAKKLPSQRCSKSLFIAFFNFSHKRPTFVFTGTHSPFGERSHTRAYTPKHGHFRWGRYYYPRTVLRGSETLRGRGLKRQTLPFLGLDPVYSRRTQRACGTAMRMMRVVVPRRRGPAGLRSPVAIFIFG